jgi:hypothetical protein
MLAWLNAYARARWHDFTGAGAAPASISWLFQSRSRILALGAPRNTPWPVAVAKISRDAASAERTQREHSNLLAIRERLPAPWVDSLPYPVGLEQVGNRVVAWERCLKGYPCPLPNEAPASASAESLSEVYRWLVNFQSASSAGTQVVTDDVLESCLASPVAALLERSHVTNRARQRVRDVARDLRGLAIPLTWRHGDLHPSNLLFLDGRLQGVIDWEMSRRADWPFYDWFQFLFEYHRELSRKRGPGVSRKGILEHTASLLFDGTCRQPEPVHSWTTRFLANYGVGTEYAPILWLKYVADVHWPEDRQALERVVVPSILHFASWDE